MIDFTYGEIKNINIHTFNNRTATVVPKKLISVIEATSLQQR